jgi:hypothetical protein
MKKTLRFTVTTLWIILTRSYDAYCTNLLTPDLSKESNPLVSVFGLSWTPLLIILSIATIYAVYAYYVSVYKPMNLLPSEKGYSFSNVVAFLYLGTKDHWTSILYKFPKDWKRLNHYLGRLLTRLLVYAGIVSTVMWILINNTDYYTTIHSVVLVDSILIGGCIVIIYFWNRSLYKQYLSGAVNEQRDPLTP